MPDDRSPADPPSTFPVLGLIKATSSSSRVAVLIRHGEKVATGPEMERPLSSLGVEEAHRLGEGLPNGRQLRIWHSPVPRCRQTAEACLAGYVQAHPDADAQIVGADPRLESWSALDIDRRARQSLIEEAGGPMGFLRAWLSDLLPAGVMHRSVDVSHDVAGSILENLRPAPAGALHLHVSHDFTLMALREHVFAPRLEDLTWADYLDGVVFEMDGEGRTVARWRDLSSTVADPA